jgi:hypothetical protein
MQVRILLLDSVGTIVAILQLVVLVLEVFLAVVVVALVGARCAVTVMCPAVLSKVVGAGEGLVAVVADVWTFLRVRAHMSIKVSAAI